LPGNPVSTSDTADAIDFRCGACSSGRKIMPNGAQIRQECGPALDQITER
jgi:hypothetical protein